MIFVVFGTQKFKFTRLIEYVNRIIDEGIVNEEIIVQYGYTSGVNILGKGFDFIGEKYFKERINEASFIICHGGVGTILNCLKLNKKVIAIPRMSSNNEHIDNHQFEICKKFKELNLILTANTYAEFKKCINNILMFSPNKIAFYEDLNPIKDKIIEFMNEVKSFKN